MKGRTAVLVIIVLLAGVNLYGHDPRARTPVKIPNILGYQTLKCDFHIHTVFSDGSVWPDIRPEEAWREGLDAIAITDHIEYQPHKDDLSTNHNRSYEIARPRGDLLRITVIQGSEVTRDMPPGHLNAIFVSDSEALDTEDWKDALKEAKRQGAFVFWNHPGWKGQQEDGVARWYPEHTELVNENLLHGIEVANEREYYPEAHRWCLEKKLTMFSNSDVHNPVNLDYHVYHGDHRPLTLVFAKDSSAESIKEALFDRRTVVYSQGMLVGEKQFLEPLFSNSIRLLNPELTVHGTGRTYLQIQNTSDIDFELVAREWPDFLEVPEDFVLQAGKIVLLEVRNRDETRSGITELSLPFTVSNLKLTPEDSLDIGLPVRVTFVPEEEDEAGE